ncbi:MAG: nicotinate (nicotinamide) nucleotide adenylyltransferase [Bacteroidales bacterium]|nr:nicotinate (nicotinamide) nucleotide adenylyltransferase [Bacteroidales bacterium]
MQIAVYSGSFNPLHIGHLAILKYLVSEGGFDCVYLIVSPKNPLKDGISAATGQDRYEAAIKAVNRHFQEGKEVMVDDIELTMPEPHYTIRTLDALREREPGNTFTLVMGADNLAGIRKWKDYRRILKEYGVSVYPRSGHDLDEVRTDLLNEDPSYIIGLMNAEMVDISSTIIRNAISLGQDASRWLM